MADKRNILPAHKVRQEKIAGRKIRMPPLNHHHIRLFAPDIARCSHDIERIRRMEPVLRILYFETVVTVVPLFLVKKKFRILHLVGDHLHIVPLRQLPAHESCIMRDTSLVGIYRADQDDFFSHIQVIPSKIMLLCYTTHYRQSCPAAQPVSPKFPITAILFLYPSIGYATL